MRPNRAVRAALNVTVPPMALRVLGTARNHIRDISQAEASPKNPALTRDAKEPRKRGYTEPKDLWISTDGRSRGQRKMTPFPLGCHTGTIFLS